MIYKFNVTQMFMYTYTYILEKKFKYLLHLYLLDPINGSELNVKVPLFAYIHSLLLNEVGSYHCDLGEEEHLY